jgi:hypothetical protein
MDSTVRRDKAGGGVDGETAGPDGGSSALPDATLLFLGSLEVFFVTVALWFSFLCFFVLFFFVSARSSEADCTILKYIVRKWDLSSR